MVFTQSTTLIITYTDNTTYLKLETSLTLYCTRLDKIEMETLISVKTLTP